MRQSGSVPGLRSTDSTGVARRSSRLAPTWRLVIYGALRRWSPQDFRATLQGYFLPASLAGLWGYRLAGLWTPSVNRFYLLSLPVVILATLLGRAINRRLQVDRFVLYVHGGLIAVGMLLLFQAVTYSR